MIFKGENAVSSIRVPKYFAAKSPESENPGSETGLRNNFRQGNISDLENGDSDSTRFALNTSKPFEPALAGAPRLERSPRTRRRERLSGKWFPPKTK